VVRPGSWVRIRDGDTEEQWEIVDPPRADVLKRRLSELSPLAFALTGRRVGDEVSVRCPDRGLRRVTILEIADQEGEAWSSPAI
jgi:transcription elongation GreA/GreB family factor